MLAPFELCCVLYRQRVFRLESAHQSFGISDVRYTRPSRHASSQWRRSASGCSCSQTYGCRNLDQLLADRLNVYAAEADAAVYMAPTTDRDTTPETESVDAE